MEEGALVWGERRRAADGGGVQCRGRGDRLRLKRQTAAAVEKGCMQWKRRYACGGRDRPPQQWRRSHAEEEKACLRWKRQTSAAVEKGHMQRKRRHAAVEEMEWCSSGEGSHAEEEETCCGRRETAAAEEKVPCRGRGDMLW